MNYFEFLYKEKRIRFYHERYGSGAAGKIKGWQSFHDPDFTVYVEPFHEMEDLVSVLDAKNTRKIKRSERMVAGYYQNDLNCDHTGIIFNANQKVKEIKKPVYGEKKNTYHPLRAAPNFTKVNKDVLEDLYQEVIAQVDLKIKKTN